MTTEKARLEARAAALEAELESRKSVTQRQVEFALGNRTEHEEDDRPNEELSASELQARLAVSRTGKGWRAV